MFFLIEVGFYLTALAVIVLAAGAVLLLVLAVGLVIHPLRTLAFVVNRAAGLAGGVGLIGAAIAWFACAHDSKDWGLVFHGSIGLVVAGIVLYGLTEWFLERPTRAERRAVERLAVMQALAGPDGDGDARGGGR